MDESNPSQDSARGWKAMARSEGIIVASCERVFYFLEAILSALYHYEYLLTLHRDRLANSKENKKCEVRHITSLVYRDCLMLFWFIATGILLPAILLFPPNIPVCVWWKHLGVMIGIWGTCEIIQHYINFALFQGIRRRYLRLPRRIRKLPSSPSPFERMLNYKTIIIRRDSEVVTSITRRIIFMVMDFWRLIVYAAVLNVSVGLCKFKDLHSFGEALYFQIVTTTTLGYGEIVPQSCGAKCAVSFEILSSFFYTIIAVSYMITLLPRMEIVSQKERREISKSADQDPDRLQELEP